MTHPSTIQFAGNEPEERSPYRIEYDNDTGPNDEGFEEWWFIIDERTDSALCRCYSEAYAKLICGALAKESP